MVCDRAGWHVERHRSSQACAYIDLSEVTDMKRFIRSDGLLVAAVVAAAAAWPLAQVASARHHHRPPSVPSAIEVPAGNEVFLVGHGVGVQIYTCHASSGGFAWSAAVPRAKLYNDHGKLIVTHFAGPTWQAGDGSKVVGQKVNSVTVDATAIPWLLLSAASTSAGPHGDRMVDTTFIQRTATTGGLTPPAANCNATTAGSTVEVPYTADYYFWKARHDRHGAAG
jgi:hypothetical protein